MERDSIIFYRSYYEAIQGLPKEIQLEVYTAVMEYGFNGKSTEDLKPVARAVFLLIKPTIDKNNARFRNGKRGGRPKKGSPETAPTTYTLTYSEEVERMKADTKWRTTICKDYSLTPEQFSERMQSFLKNCTDNRNSRPHDSLDDAKSHFRFWMDKKYRATSPTASGDTPPADCDFTSID